MRRAKLSVEEPDEADQRKTAVKAISDARDAEAAKPLHLEAGVFIAVFSPDSKFFATVSNTVTTSETQLWDAVTRTPLGEPVKGRTYGQAVFTPDSRQLLVELRGFTGTPTKGVLLDTATGKPADPPLDFKEELHVAAFHPNGELITFSRDRRGARLWDVKKLAPVGEFLEHGEYVHMVHLSPDGKTLLTMSERSLGFWDLHTGKPIGPLVKIADGGFQGAIFSPDSKTVVLGGDRSARMWRVPTPMQADAKDIRLWLEVNTGQELDAGGTFVDLDARTWRERYDRLQKLGGLPMP